MTMQMKKQLEVVTPITPTRPTATQQPLINPVADLWEIELLYGRHNNFSELTYAAEFKTKLVGGASRCFLVIEMRERFEEFLYDLNVFGVMERSMFLKAIDYVIQLKIRGIYREVPDLLIAINGQADNSESQVLYEHVTASILSDIESYPTISSNQYRSGSNPGVILDIDQYTVKYGSEVVGVSSETLYEILGFEPSSRNAKRIQEITRSWHRQGYLVKKSPQPRLQEAIRPNADSKDVKRFYLFKIEGVGELVVDEEE